MDTSETYIEMCEKATEVQNFREPPDLKNRFRLEEGFTCGKHFYLFAFYYVPEQDFDYWWIELGEKEEFDWRKVKGCWLPRQDQLQEMVDMRFSVLMVRIKEFEDWCWGTKYLFKFSSFEQLWMALVMREKYNKIWNGEDWVKADEKKLRSM